MSGSQSVLQFILKVLDGVQVRASEFLPHQTGKPIPLWSWGIVVLKQEQAFLKLLPESWNRTIV